MRSISPVLGFTTGAGLEVIEASHFPGRGSITGLSILSHGPYTDFFVPHIAATAVIGALDYRRRTGRGQYIELSQLEASIHCLETAILDYSVNSREQVRIGVNDRRTRRVGRSIAVRFASNHDPVPTPLPHVGERLGEGVDRLAVTNAATDPHPGPLP